MTESSAWKQLLPHYGRDAAWLEGATTAYRSSTRSAPLAVPRAACVTLNPDPEADFGVHYGLGSGQTLHFLLESAPNRPTPDPAWDGLLDGLTGLFCIPVKTGSAALGWQLGLTLTAVRPLAMLRPYYLFCRLTLPAALDTAGCRRVSLADTHRLGKLLDSGYLGVSLLPDETVVCLPHPPLREACPPGLFSR